MLEESVVISKIRTLNYRDLLIFLIPFIIFLYYLHVYSPGILVFDSYNQLHQIATGNFNNWHPFFHTFIEMMCLKVYGSPASVAVLQIIVFSTIWMVICKYNRDDSVKSKLGFGLQLLVTLIISLIPINPIFAINLQKDILFSYCLLLLCFLMEVLIDRKGEVGYPFAILFSIVLACTAQLRQNGMILVIVFMVILVLLFYFKYKNYRLAITIPAVAVALILLITSLSIVYDVTEHQNEALMDITVHMLVDYEMSLKLDPEDQAKVNDLVSHKQIDKHYNIFFKDPTRNHIVHKDVWKKDRYTYVAMAIKYSILHPKHFITYMFKSAPIVWDITRESGWKEANGVVYITDIENQKLSFYNKWNETPATDFDNVSAANVGTAEYQALNGFATLAKENLILDTLFDSPALYMYLAFILLAALYWITRIRDLWLVYLPNLLNIAIVFVSIPAQLNRYLYSNLLVFYMLVIILIMVLVNRKTTTA